MMVRRPERLEFPEFEARVRQVVGQKVSWLREEDPRLRDLQWSFIRYLFWIYRSRNVANFDGFVLGLARQDGSTAEIAQRTLQPASVRFGPDCGIDDRELQAFIDPKMRERLEPEVESPEPPLATYEGLTEVEVIDAVMADAGFPAGSSDVDGAIREDFEMPESCRYFFSTYGNVEFSDGFALEEPWISEEHVRTGTFWVIGRCWKHADGDDLLLDPADGTVYLYLHEERGRLVHYASSFAEAVVKLSRE